MFNAFPYGFWLRRRISDQLDFPPFTLVIIYQIKYYGFEVVRYG